MTISTTNVNVDDTKQKIVHYRYYSEYAPVLWGRRTDSTVDRNAASRSRSALHKGKTQNKRWEEAELLGSFTKILIYSSTS